MRTTLLHSPALTLYLGFREGVLEIQRGEAGVKLAPVNRAIKHFEYGCWTTYDTL